MSYPSSVSKFNTSVVIYREIYHTIKNTHAIVWSITLVALFITQYFYNWAPGWLTVLQSMSAYKQITGLLLFIYVLYQWQLALPKGESHHASEANRARHRHLGIYAPILLFIHSVELGYAYQIGLTTLFLANCIIGSLAPSLIGIKNRYYYSAWLHLHIIIAICILALLVFHLYVTYAY